MKTRELKATMGRASFTLDWNRGEGEMRMAPGFSPRDVVKALRVLDVIGWMEVDGDESGDPYEVWDDGTTVVPLALNPRGPSGWGLSS